MLEDYSYKHGVNEDEICEELRKQDNTDIIKNLDCLTIVMDGTSEIHMMRPRNFMIC